MCLLIMCAVRFRVIDVCRDCSYHLYFTSLLLSHPHMHPRILNTGAIAIAPLPIKGWGQKPGSASLPFFGIQPVLLSQDGKVRTRGGVKTSVYLSAGVCFLEEVWCPLSDFPHSLLAPSRNLPALPKGSSPSSLPGQAPFAQSTAITSGWSKYIFPSKASI